MNGFIIGGISCTLIGLMIIGLETVLENNKYYKLSSNEWKCEKVININDDITKVECVNYIKKEK